MAISTYGTVLKISGEGLSAPIEVAIKSFPDLGAAPAAIEVTTLKDDAQKFIPGIKGMAAMEFVANYDGAKFEELSGSENKQLTYTLNFGVEGSETYREYRFDGAHTVLIVGGGLNAAVDMKVVVLPSSKIEKVEESAA